ncbi:MAG: MBL fold metallo-hydrolase [Planctomycetota bacterium]|jgi:phosphoribosyl 1,2-cyclic phosphate phosphodiesterase|nr:MBL fold metallo-hydrolase [Planctomycetota bacterium]
MANRVEIEFLGTGTSVGVPVPSCSCPVCQSSDRRDQRGRSSVLVRQGRRNLVIDTGPDFRQQCLRTGLTRLDAVLLTHHHYDHIMGIDDLRAFTLPLPGHRRRPGEKIIPVWGSRKTLATIRRSFAYIWKTEQSGGGLPQISLNSVPPDRAFTAAGLDWTPIPIRHGILDILGYRLAGFAYLTDISALPEESAPLLANLSVLVVSCIRRMRSRTHFRLSDVLALSRRLKPETTIITHISHHFSHQELLQKLPSHIRPAYDGMRLTLPI